MKLRALLFILLLFTGGLSHASVIPLFDCAGGAIQFSRFYDELVLKLKPGDQINLCKDHGLVTIEEKLGKGNRAFVFSIVEDPNSVLRLSVAKNYYEFMTATVDGYIRLEENEVPRVLLLEHERSFWVKAERLAVDDFITFKEFDDDFVFERDQRVLEKLRVFVLKTAMFNTIGDLHSRNLVFSKSKDEWLLLDWDDGHYLYKIEYYTNSHPIFVLSPANPKVRLEYLELIEEVGKIRKDYAKKESLMSYKEFLKPLITQAECRVNLMTRI